MNKVLVVDDDVTCCHLMKSFAEAAGFEATTAVNGKEALEKFQSGDFQIVVTDYEMPEMNGVELMTAILGKKPGTPVIMLTGDADSRLKKRVWDLGAYDFLNKPVEGNKMTHILRTARAFAIPGGKTVTTQPNAKNSVGETGPLSSLIEIIGLDAVAETVEQFKEQSQIDVEGLQMAADGLHGDESLAKLAHRLKGASASLGLSELAKVCSDLEHQAKAFQKYSAETHAQIAKELEKGLDSLQENLKQAKRAA